jgi:hypothetical protein
VRVPEGLEARYSRTFRNGWTVFLGAWVAVGAVMFLTGMVWVLPPLRVVGMVIFAAFLPLLFYARIRMTSPHPVIALGPGGYLDSRLGTPIPWAEITGLRRHIAGSRIILQIEVERPERFLERAGPTGILMRRINPRMGFPVIGSNLSGMDVPQERIAAAAEACWEKQRAG